MEGGCGKVWWEGGCGGREGVEGGRLWGCGVWCEEEEKGEERTRHSLQNGHTHFTEATSFDVHRGGGWERHCTL